MTKRTVFQSLFEFSPQAMALMGVDGHSILVNQALCELLGFSKAELEDKSSALKNFKQMEMQWKCKDGSEKWVGTKFIALPEAATAVFFTDLTEAKKNESEKDSQKISLAASAKLASLGEMAGGVAHEINNPLTIIQGKVGHLRRLVNEPKLNRAAIEFDLERIKVTTTRIAKIVSGLRSFSRNADQDPLEYVELRDILDETLSLCQEKFKNSGVEIRQGNFAGIEMKCRSIQISQVILNLLNNAYDAIENLPKKWIEIEINLLSDSLLALSVTDSGSGISQDVVQKMMTPFFTTKEVGKGTGLGLSISKGIIEDHGGKLSYDENCVNTRFVIELPYRITGLKSEAS